MIYPDKLPDIGTTIFTVMSAMAQEYDAVNLSQGFPDFQPPNELLDLVNRYIQSGANQYAPMAGIPALREAIAKKTNNLYSYLPNADDEITITSGATEGLFVAINTITEPGDEVIILEPAYDSYEPAIRLNGGKAVPLKLEAPDFALDFEKLNSLINSKTKAIIINSPHNPTGSILDKYDMQKLASIVENNDIWVISDEVYEHIIFDGEEHQSALRFESLRRRSFVISSFGKTYHNTGWKIGYCIAPKNLTASFRKIHQYVTFSTHTPSQFAFADFLSQEAHYLDLPTFYQDRRDTFIELISESSFDIKPSKGTYFQLLSYDHLSQSGDRQFAEKLTKEFKIASIPISVFYSDNYDPKMLRFCFAKSDETLEKAAKILNKL